MTIRMRIVGWLAALGLLVLAPVTAEYLSGYDDSVGKPLELVGNLFIFVPLYGAPALLIRELVRRTGRGWPSILLLGAAFGVVQAGLVDQSMFNTSYRDIGYWGDMLWPTYIPVLGIGAFNTVSFVSGHMVASMSAPIAVIESLVPRRRTAPWLGRIGLAVIAVAYVLASVVVYRDSVRTEHFQAAPGQLAGAAVVAIMLVVLAFVIGRHPRPRVDRWAAPPWLAGVLAAVAVHAADFLPPTWVAVTVMLVPIAVLAVLVARWSRSTRWGAGHVLALSAGVLLAQAAEAFFTDPLGDIALVAKLAHNTVLAVGVIGLIAAGALALRRGQAVSPADDRRL